MVKAVGTAARSSLSGETDVQTNNDKGTDVKTTFRRVKKVCEVSPGSQGRFLKARNLNRTVKHQEQIARQMTWGEEHSRPKSECLKHGGLGGHA